MQTKLSQRGIKNTAEHKAEKILKSCVHCGFCLATCPTYQLLGNELDSPRGRIYLIKSALEDNYFTHKSIKHLDQCLTCRACETTCPSGVEYSELITIGRNVVEHKRPVWQKMYRYCVRKLVSSRYFMRLVAPLMKQSTIQTPSVENKNPVKGRLLLLTGCVQSSLTPNTHHVAKNVLTTLGYNVSDTPQHLCCGAIDLHASAHQEAIKQIKHNIDRWESLLQSDIDLIISTASGCGMMIKDYPTLFEPHDDYYQKAVALADKTRDIAEFLTTQNLSNFTVKNIDIAYQSPCSLQHGQKLAGVVEHLLQKLGYILKPITDAHLCCGSAGTYAIFQPKIATQLRDKKITHLTQSKPALIVTANVGCQLHLAKGTDIPVKHWIELFDR